VRLGVYIDFPYRRSGDVVSSDEPVVRFFTGLAPRLGELTFFGRLDPEPGVGAYPLPAEGVRFVPLPHYPSVADVPGVVRAVRGSCAAVSAELERLDALLLFGPHPMSLAFAAVARRRRRPLLLGVRQDFPAYVRNRIPSRLWIWTVGAAVVAERAYRLLARRHPAIVVGEELSRVYGAGGGDVLTMAVSLIREQDLAPLEAALAKPWDGELRLFNAGRLDPEKNPTLMPEVLALLREQGRPWRLAVAGEGPMASAVRKRAAELGVAGAVDLLGYVPNGPALWDEYRRSHAFLHVSLTEGLPQVLFEAQAAGLPVVATAVGGVPPALDGGASGLLIPPADARAAARAVERLERDEALRHRLIAAGHRRAAEETMDKHLDRIAEFVRRHVDQPA
jgi:glycosyltransferase involved in cell wall biosynthesis